MPFMILFALIWSGMTLLFDCSTTHAFYKQFESGKFPSVTGTITHSEVQEHTGRKGNVSYTAVVDYVYKVNGQVFTGDRLVFGEDQPGSAATIVESHPVSSAVQVYYNPKNPGESLLYPGLAHMNFMWVLALTPFNMVMIGVWIAIGGRLRLRLFRPVAGGVEVIEDGMTTRVRLPRWGAIWWALMTTGGLGFVFIFVIGVAMRMHPLTKFVLPVTFLIYLAGIGVYVWRSLKINSGDEDLVINEASRTMELPQTFGRKERVTVGLGDIKTLWVETIEHRGSKGTSYSYAPTLSFRGDKQPQKLADWQDKLKADQFTEWLGVKMGISKQMARF